ncbi:MAG: 50S ribosomal subunit-associated GTPase HflX [Arenicella sp.]|jgi:50S ribosomal subunit-associated GTPase HflX
MSRINGKRIIISGLVSSKINLEEFLIPIRSKLKESGAKVIGELIQRRGVSRSKKAGGSTKLNQPLSSRTYISSGKIDELKVFSDNLNADFVVFINNLTDNQIENIESLIELKIEVITNI